MSTIDPLLLGPIAGGTNCQVRVLRGGSWVSLPQFFRSAARDRIAADTRSFYFGFRVARTFEGGCRAKRYPFTLSHILSE